MASISDISIMLFPWGASSPKVEDIVAAAKLAEDLGFYSVTLPTHMTMPPGWLFKTFPNRDVLDTLAILPALATATSTIKIGFNSALLPLLPPYQWAKYISTLDVMSGGRVIFGVAMGWWEEDFAAVGVERKKRGKLFDEQLEAVTALLSEDKTTFEGDHYRLKDMTLDPKPLQKPYPPIWIGGGVKSVWRAARFGEYLLCFWPTEDEARTVWVPKLREEGEKYGTEPKLASFTFAYVARDEQDLQSYMPRLREAVAFENPDIDPLAVTFAGTPERCAERINALAAAGVSHFVVEFQFHGLETVDFGMRQMETFVREVGPLL